MMARRRVPHVARYQGDTVPSGHHVWHEVSVARSVLLHIEIDLTELRAPHELKLAWEVSHDGKLTWQPAAHAVFVEQEPGEDGVVKPIVTMDTFLKELDETGDDSFLRLVTDLDGPPFRHGGIAVQVGPLPES